MSRIEPIYGKVGAVIATVRVDRGISQATLGRRLRPPMLRASIQNMESGKQRIMLHVLVGIADALSVSVAHLLPGSVVEP